MSEWLLEVLDDVFADRDVGIDPYHALEYFLSKKPWCLNSQLYNSLVHVLRLNSARLDRPLCADVVRLLLKAGANPNQRTCMGADSTPLHEAVILDTPSIIINIMLTHTPPLIVKNSDGDTILHLAMYNGRTDLFETIASEAPLMCNVKNNQGYTPILLAMRDVNTASTALRTFTKFREDRNNKIVFRALANGIGVAFLRAFPKFLTPLLTDVDVTAKIACRVKNGFTAIQYLLEKGSIPSVETLIEYATENTSPSEILRHFKTMFSPWPQSACRSWALKSGNTEMLAQYVWEACPEERNAFAHYPPASIALMLIRGLLDVTDPLVRARTATPSFVLSVCSNVHRSLILTDLFCKEHERGVKVRRVDFHPHLDQTSTLSVVKSFLGLCLHADHLFEPVEEWRQQFQFECDLIF